MPPTPGTLLRATLFATKNLSCLKIPKGIFLTHAPHGQETLIQNLSLPVWLAGPGARVSSSERASGSVPAPVWGCFVTQQTRPFSPESSLGQANPLPIAFPNRDHPCCLSQWIPKHRYLLGSYYVLCFRLQRHKETREIRPHRANLPVTSECVHTLFCPLVS